MFLGDTQQHFGNCFKVVETLEFLAGIEDIAKFIEEPLVDFGKVVDTVYGITLFESFRNNEDTAVGRLFKRSLDIGNVYLAVFGETVHTLADHSQAFLNRFFECAANGHNLAHRFHRRADMAVNAMELAEVPAGYLHYYVVERGLEECRCTLGDAVLEVKQSVAEGKLRCHESKGITGGLRRKGRRTAQTCVDLDYAVIHRRGVVGILHVALANDTDVADNLDSERTQVMIVVVAEGLRGCYNDTLAGVDAERVEVLHVADGDTVVVAVAHNFVLNFLPALERFLNEHLGRERESFFYQRNKFVVVVAETAAEAAESICSTHNHGVSEAVGHAQGIINGIYSLAADSLNIDFAKFLHE